LEKEYLVFFLFLLIEAGKLIDIKVLDHVIIGNGSWWSWVEYRV